MMKQWTLKSVRLADQIKCKVLIPTLTHAFVLSYRSWYFISSIQSSICHPQLVPFCLLNTLFLSSAAVQVFLFIHNPFCFHPTITFPTIPFLFQPQIQTSSHGIFSHQAPCIFPYVPCFPSDPGISEAFPWFVLCLFSFHSHCLDTWQTWSSPK